VRKFYFIALLLFSVNLKAQNQTFVKYQIPKELAGRQVQIKAGKQAIFFFKNDELKQKIYAGQKSRILVSGDDNFLYSKGKIGLENVVLENQESEVSGLLYRNTPTPKPVNLTVYLSFWVLIILVLVTFIKIGSIDMYYGLILPWVAYSNTQELVSKVSPYRLILPSLLFAISLIAAIWVFNPEYSWFDLLFAIGLIMAVFVFKVILLYMLEFLFESRGLARKHVLEYLKMGIFFFITLFILRTLEILNYWDFSKVYKIIMSVYIFVWFVRLLFLIYKEGQQKLIYFFSYLCVSEAVPILLITAFWKS
jgi:hypothetical protein